MFVQTLRERGAINHEPETDGKSLNKINDSITFHNRNITIDKRRKEEIYE